MKPLYLDPSFFVPVFPPFSAKRKTLAPCGGEPEKTLGAHQPREEEHKGTLTLAEERRLPFKSVLTKVKQINQPSVLVLRGGRGAGVGDLRPRVRDESLVCFKGEETFS